MARTVAELLKEQLNLDGFSRENPESTTIGTTAAIVARNNPNRAALLIVNLSTVDMFARPRATDREHCVSTSRKRWHPLSAPKPGALRRPVSTTPSPTRYE